MRRSLSAITLAIVLTSCVSNEVAVPDAVETPITFSVLQKGMSSRASVSGNVYPKDVPFGTYAYLLEAGKTWANDKVGASLYINNDEVSYHQDAVGRFAANSWYSSIIHYWPQGGRSLTFFSYSPKSINMGCSPSTGLTLNDYQAGTTAGDAADGGEGIDIMTAMIEDQVTNVSSSGTYHAGVPTAFKHICCQVEVFAKLDNKDENADYKVNSITLNNLWTVADFSNDVWSGHNTSKNVKYTLDGTSGALNTDGTTPTVVFPPMIVIPQNLLASGEREAPGITINYTYKDGNEYKTVSVHKEFVKDINGLVQAWKKGKKYILTIAFSTEDAYLKFDTSVKGWIDGDSSSITVGQ